MLSDVEELVTPCALNATSVNTFSVNIAPIQSIGLCAIDVLQTRYSFKYRPGDAKLTLTVTNDIVVRSSQSSSAHSVSLRAPFLLTVLHSNVCPLALQTYKFKTDQADDINYVDKLNQAFVRLMSAPVPSVDLLQGACALDV